MRRRQFIVAIGLVLLAARGSSAQETPRFGLVMGYPTQAGVLVRLSDRVSIRPDISWSQSSLEATTTLITFGPGIGPPITTLRTTTTESTQIGIGVSGLFFLRARDQLRIYVSPRITYGRARSTSDAGTGSLDSRNADPIDTVTNNYGGAGALGAPYALGTRFGVFGELGASYSRTGRPATSSSSIISANTTSRTTAIRTSVGVIVFF